MSAWTFFWIVVGIIALMVIPPRLYATFVRDDWPERSYSSRVTDYSITWNLILFCIMQLVSFWLDVRGVAA